MAFCIVSNVRTSISTFSGMSNAILIPHLNTSQFIIVIIFDTNVRVRTEMLKIPNISISSTHVRFIMGGLFSLKKQFTVIWLSTTTGNPITKLMFLYSIIIQQDQ